MAEDDTLEDCPFCDTLGTDRTIAGPVDINERLRTTRHFIVIPALGPLVLGHALAVTREHSSGLLHCSLEVRSDYEAIALQLRSHCAKQGLSLLEAEHGGPGQIYRGPCIAHTHIHLLPGWGEYVDAFSETLPTIAVEQLDLCTAYISLRNAEDIRLHDASSAPGQQLRRTLAERAGIEVWDWALDAKLDLITATSGFWRES